MPWKPEGTQEKLKEDSVKAPGGFGEVGWRPWVLGVQDRRQRSGASAGQPAGRGGCDLREKQGLLA